ncbi:putative hydrolase [Paraburkholderia piptadeniae]|uniref:Hydrolase n=1 Tax=Paraburkholderia piptadeniae TaxID=1701573 RepID=A0A1N7S0A9_9BURK|nr:alpha/beta hydrolase [Paraburkholderia piptadeniae]SIT40764.1 putative hydrolase [Paraburkholderia piptadeniae]
MLEDLPFEFEGHAVAGYTGGRMGRMPLLLMHGLGPGASIASAFQAVLPFLTRHFHVFAMDWIGFGRSARKQSEPYFDFSFWVRQARALIERMPTGPVAVFGHSMSGAVSLRLAASEPRVAAVMTTGSVGTRFPVNAHLQRLWTYPRSLDDLRVSMRSLMYDATGLDDELLAKRWAVLADGDYGDYFTRMFDPSQALADTWEISAEELARIKVPYTFVHGRDDLACPAEETSMRLAQHILHSDLALIARCGHAPSVEHPQKICALVRSAFSSVVQFEREI